MTPQQFLMEFGSIASATNGVQKLREMVLQLAMQGRLAHQETNESALFQLQSSREEMARLMKVGLAKKEKSALPVREDEAWTDLPVGWAWCRLVDLGQFINGDAFKPSDWGVTGRPIIRIQNLSGRNNEFNRTTKVVDDSIIVRPGDILVSWSATLDAYVWNGEEGVLNQHIFRVLASPAVDRLFLFWILKHSIRRLANSDHAHGLVMAHINRGPFLALPIALPPLAEQKRIVAKVDELMALCDRLEALQNLRKSQRSVLTKELLGRLAQGNADDVQKCLQNLSHLVTDADQVPEIRKAILSLAVQGKLVPQDPRDESAQKRLKRLGLSAKFVTDHVELPSSWVCVLFDSVAEVTGGVTLGRSLKNKKLIKLPYLRVANVKRGEIDVGAMKEIEIGEDEIGRYSLNAGDVLMTEGGDWDKVGRTAVWNNELPLCLHQNHVFRARLRADELMPLWFERYFNSPIGRAYFEGAAKQTTNLASINMRQVKSCPVAIPPLAEQKRIVAKADQLMALCDTLEAKLRKASEVQEQLAASSVAALTGIQTQEKETMKAPKTELVARLKLGKKPSTKEHAPLASLLVRHNNELSPNALLQHSSLDIDGFYRQLKIEMNHGWIVQPEVPSMKVEERR